MRRYQQTYNPAPEAPVQPGTGIDWSGKPFIEKNTFLRTNKDQAYVNSCVTSYSSYDRNFNYFLFMCQDGTQYGDMQSYTDFFDTKLIHSYDILGDICYHSNWGQSVVKPFSFNSSYFYMSQSTYTYTQNSAPRYTNLRDGGIVPLPAIVYNIADDDINKCNLQLFYRLDVYPFYSSAAGIPLDDVVTHVNNKLRELYASTPTEAKSNITNRNLHGWYGTNGMVTSDVNGYKPFLDGRFYKTQFVRYRNGYYYYCPAQIPTESNYSCYTDQYQTGGPREQYSCRVYSQNATLVYAEDLIQGDVVFARSIQMDGWAPNRSSLQNIDSTYICTLNIIGVLVPQGAGLPKIDI